MGRQRHGARHLGYRMNFVFVFARGLPACLLPILVGLLLGGCSSVVQRNPVPQKLVDQAQIVDFPGVRFWGDEKPANAEELLRESHRRQAAAGLLHDDSGNPVPSISLALSGGGANGAFGAGLLKGWSEAGTRPAFSIVTGVSTGALIAPFAFVGPEYDGHLEKLFTTTHTEDIFRLRALLSIFGGDSFSDTSPLWELLARYIDEAFLGRVAGEHAKGRSLWIGTTNLDAQRPVIWDMGAIAASKHPRAAELFRAVMLASSAIGGAFPPVYIPVEADGQRYDEMHVDGGTSNQVFLYPAALDMRDASEQAGVQRKREVFVIRNARISPQWEAVEPRFGQIAVRSVATLIKTQGIGDLFRIYVGARRDGMAYHLASIPDDFQAESRSQFDPVYMRQLFDFAYELARNGYPWVREPPGFAPPEVE